MSWLLFQGPEARLENWIRWGLIALMAGGLGNQWGTGASGRHPELLRSGSDAAEASGLPTAPWDALGRIGWTLPLIATLVAIALLLGLALLYLRCRFRFVMLDGVLSGAPRIRGVFGRTGGPGLGYFAFELLLACAAVALLVPLLVAWWPIARDALAGFRPAGRDLVLPILFSVAYGLPVAIALALVEWFAQDFVLPLAWTGEGGFWRAFGRAWRLFFANLGSSLFFLLLRVLVGLVAVFAITLATCFSCCLWLWPAAIGIVALVVACSWPFTAFLLAPIALAALFLAAWIIAVVIAPLPVLFRAWSYAYVRVLAPELPDWAPEPPPA